MSEEWAKEQFAQKTSDLLIFGDQPERIAHGRSFLVSNLSALLTSLIKKEGMSKSHIFF